MRTESRYAFAQTWPCAVLTPISDKCGGILTMEYDSKHRGSFFAPEWDAWVAWL